MKNRASSEASPEKDNVGVTLDKYSFSGNIIKPIVTINYSADWQINTISPLVVPPFPVETHVQGASPLGIEGSPSLRAAGRSPGSVGAPDTSYNLIHSPIMNYVDKVTPGHGLPDPKCGTISSRSVRAKVMCPEDPAHYTRTIFDSCHRPACPVCWPSWADRAAGRIADTVTGFKTAHNYQYYPNHIDISPHPDIVPFDKPSPECLSWLLEEVNDRLDVLGVVAAALIPHPYRIRDECKRYVNDKASEAHVNRYVWALKQDNWFALVYFSPHVHAITYGKLRHVHDFERLTNWQYHNHGRTKSREDVLKVSKYLLSHAWVRGNSKTVRYVRGMSSTKLLVISQDDNLPDLCPVCHTHAVRVPYYGDDSDGNEIQPYQDLRSCDKAYRHVMTRIVTAKVSIDIIRARLWAAAAAWVRRYYRDHSLFMCYAQVPSICLTA